MPRKLFSAIILFGPKRKVIVNVAKISIERNSTNVLHLNIVWFAIIILIQRIKKKNKKKGKLCMMVVYIYFKSIITKSLF